MEAAAIESGSSLPGALSAFAVRVHLPDVLLDGQRQPLPPSSVAAQQALAQQHEAAAAAAKQLDATAALAQLQQRGRRRLKQLRSASAAAAAAPAAASTPPPQQALAEDAAVASELDPATLPVFVALPRARAVAQRLQRQLAGLLAACKYDLRAARERAVGALDAQVAALQAALPEGKEAPAEEKQEEQPGAGDAAAPAPGSVAAARAVLGAVQRLRTATAELFDALDAALLAQPPAAPAAAAAAADDAAPASASAAPAAWRSSMLEQERQVHAVGAALARLLPSLGAPPSPEQQGELEAAVAPLAGVPAQLLRALLALPPPLRAKFLDGAPQLAASLNAAGERAGDSPRAALVPCLPSVADHTTSHQPRADANASLAAAGADLPSLRTRAATAPTTTPAAGATSSPPVLPELAHDVLGATYLSPHQYQALQDRLAAVHAATLALDAARARLAPPGAAAAQGADGAATTMAGVLGVLPELRRLRAQYQATATALQQQLARELVQGRPSAAQLLKVCGGCGSLANMPWACHGLASWAPWASWAALSTAVDARGGRWRALACDAGGGGAAAGGGGRRRHGGAAARAPAGGAGAPGAGGGRRWRRGRRRGGAARGRGGGRRRPGAGP